jgi:hypothetical protein
VEKNLKILEEFIENKEHFEVLEKFLFLIGLIKNN